MENIPINATVDEACKLSQMVNPKTGLPYVSEASLVGFLTAKALEVQRVGAPYTKEETNYDDCSVVLK